MSQSEAVLTSNYLGGENLGSFIQRVLDEVGRASDADVEATKRAMVSAMRHFEPLRLWFKEDTFTFNTVTDQQAYSIVSTGDDGYASDYISPVNAYILVGGTRWLPMEQVDISDMRWLTPTDTVVGVPTRWAWFNDQIWLTPIPNNNTSEQIRFDYIGEPGVPAYYWDGVEWAFFGPTGATLTNNWTSPWFTLGEELLRARTKWDLYYNYFDDAENAGKMGGYDGDGGMVGMARDNIMKRHASKKYNVGRRVTYV